MAYVGGLRARIIHTNLYDVINDGLSDLGWLADSNSRNPVVVRMTQVDNDEQIVPNVVSITAEDVNSSPAEMGSGLSDSIWLYYVDVYAEDNVLGLHLANDIKDILQGRFTNSVSRIGPEITIYDSSVVSATPIELFSVSIDDVEVDKSRFFEKPFQKNWWVVSFSVTDTYNDESD